jgi:hypothetical protein
MVRNHNALRPSPYAELGPGAICSMEAQTHVTHFPQLEARIFLHFLLCFPDFPFSFYTNWPPLWSSDKSSWLQIQRLWFDSRSYQVSSEVVGLERGPLSLVSTIEELLERKSSGPGLENENTAVGIRRADHVTTSLRENCH